MAWFKLSDDWLEDPNQQRAGKNGRALWIAAANRCAKHNLDGLIEGDLLKGVAALADVPLTATVRKLVELKLWHDHATIKSCAECQRDLATINDHRRADGNDLIVVREGDYYHHGWAKDQLSKHRTMSVEARMAEDRSRALRKDTTLCRAIQERDQGRCRFCGIRVNWRDRRGPARATYDHLDPFCFTPNGGNYLEAVVTACGPCNSDKGQRTAEEWAAAGGNTLKPAGWKPGDHDPTKVAEMPLDAAAATWRGSSPDQIQTRPEPGARPSSPHVHGRPHAPLGPGRVGPGPGLGLGRVGAGLAGLVRSGAGGVGSAEGAPPSPGPDPTDGSTSSTTDASSNSGDHP